MPFKRDFAGIQGIQIIYNYSLPTDLHHMGKTERIPKIAYEAYFENTGILYNINIHSILDIAEQAKVDYEHIVQTFIILD